jgi:ribosome-binding protein aMBF1 (putative translation factor)
MVLVSCKICGKQINRRPSDLKTKSGHSFCSLKCAGKYAAEMSIKRKGVPDQEIQVETAREKQVRRPQIEPMKRPQRKVLLVDKGLRPVNSVAREAWDRRIMAGEIRYYQCS